MEIAWNCRSGTEPKGFRLCEALTVGEEMLGVLSVQDPVGCSLLIQELNLNPFKSIQDTFKVNFADDLR